MVVVVVVMVVILLDRFFDNDRIGRQQQSGNAGGVLESRADDLCRVDDPELDHVTVLVVQGVVTVVDLLALDDAAGDDGSVLSSVFGNGANGHREHIEDQLGAVLFVAVELEFLDHLVTPQQRDSAAGHDALVDGRTGGGQGVIDQVLAFLHGRLCGSPDVDLGHAAGELGQSLLQLLDVVLALGDLDLLPDLLGPTVDRRLVAGALDHRGVLGVDDDLADGAQLVNGDVFELDAKVLEDGLPAGQHGDVFHLGLAAVAVAGGLDGGDLEDAAELVDDQCRQRLAIDVLGNDQQRLSRFGDRFQQRHQVLGIADLLFPDQNPAVLQFADLRVLVGDEVRREIPAFELHALDQVDLGVDLPAFLDGDHAIVADFQQSIGQDRTDLGIVVSSDRGHGGDRLLVIGFHRSGHLAELLEANGDCLVDTARHRHGVGTGGNVLQPRLVNGFGEHGGRGRPVTSDVTGLRSNLLDQLNPHVFEGVLHLDVLGDGHAVLGHLGSAPALVEHGVAAARPQRALDGTGQLRHSSQQALASVFIKCQQLRHGLFLTLPLSGSSECKSHVEVLQSSCQKDPRRRKTLY